ncbi:polyprenyl synthetase family protein [Candidatus Odyssella thessalonicensis]|uniref:polyprenyl synthetase family protein n=1 Tax=Candidatus Odyssella thessalonicensis TaxID=84647 RepID=UPI000225B460|nr:polyprenyl synthetase family protein [Candidatus Odyssella thessalonicensis]
MALAAICEKSLSAFDHLSALVADSMHQVDCLIDENLKSDIPLIEQIAKHIIYAGGKRLRPALVILASHIHGTVSAQTIALAAAIEFIHTATLLHDDVIDESDLRRGNQSAHKIWGNTTAILVGDFLFAKAFELMVQTNSLRVLQILSKTSAIISAGEVRQLMETHSFDLSLETSLQIMGAKTAELFGAACQTGALVAGATEKEAGELYLYGYNLGLIFQITDDVLDYQAQDDSRGKIPGDDFREGKITLPIIFAYQNATEQEKAFLEKTMISLEQAPDDLERARDLIINHGGFEKSLALAANLCEQAQSCIHQSHQFKPLLTGLVQECLSRTK